MHGHDRACSGRDGPFDSRGVDIESPGINVHENRSRADLRDRAGRGDKSKRCGDDFVTGTDAERVQRQYQCVGAGRTANGVFALREFGELVFKRRDFRTQNELLAFESFCDRLINFLPDGCVLRSEIQKGMAYSWRHFAVEYLYDGHHFYTR